MRLFGYGFNSRVLHCARKIRFSEHLLRTENVNLGTHYEILRAISHVWMITVYIEKRIEGKSPCDQKCILRTSSAYDLLTLGPEPEVNIVR